MAAAALVLYGVSLFLTFGVRIVVQLRRTGSTGVHGLPAGAGPLELLAGSLFIIGLVMGAAAPVLALTGVVEPLPSIDGIAGHVVGILLAVTGIGLTFGAQMAMGDSWRIGVDPDEQTSLVTAGPFQLVRNPIYSAMLPTVFGLVLMVPSVVSIAAFVTLAVGLELQVRCVEEPYLLEVHGEQYAEYAASVGRFVPRLGLRHGARVASTVLLAATLGSAVLAPGHAGALDSDLKGLAVFRLEASHGYSILGLAASERVDGRGDIFLLVYRRGASASYFAPAVVTPTRLEADLGAVGRISAEMVPSGRKETLRSHCGDHRASTVEPRLYQGRFEFHGEESYADAVATEVPEALGFLADLVCPGRSRGEVSGAGLPGARLRVFRRRQDRHLSLQLNKNGSGKATVFSAELGEVRDGIRIERSVSGRQPARVFEYDPLLRTATVAPFAPFSGTARFRTAAAPANRWTGTLSVDFPGRSNVSLTAAREHASIVHAELQNEAP